MATINAIGSNKPITVPFGGTGTATLTANGVLVGEGTGSVAVTAAGTNGQVLVGSTGADPAFTTLTSSAGTILYTTGAHTLNLEASYTQTARPAFSAYVSAPIANVTGDGTVYTIIYDTVLYDQASNYNNATGIFTAPVTGIYLFTVSYFLTGLGVANIVGSVTIQTTGYQVFLDQSGMGIERDSSSNLIVSNRSAQVKLTAGSTAFVLVTVYSGAKIVGVGAGTASTALSTFSCYQVC